MTPLCLVVQDWPETDRETWRLAQDSAGFLGADKPVSHWSRARRRIVEQAYGQWLAFPDRDGAPTRRAHPRSARPRRVSASPSCAPAQVSVATMLPAPVRIRSGARLRDAGAGL